MAKPYFDNHVFSLTAAEAELTNFKALLDANTELAERDQVLANFKRWPNLCALMGQYNSRLGTADLIRREFRVLPHFRTDLTVRRAGTDCICLIEFEGASDRHIFEDSDRGIDTWARPFEKGFSQVVDWTWALDHYRKTGDYVDAFGSERPNIVGLLVIGRSTSLLTTVRKDRWEWRRNKVKADSFTLTLVTFDELYGDFEMWLGLRKMDRGTL
ncbi:MAG: Shedu anti-phage system protein SduA domain-containing protein [Janthinobacterium lividum]